jgi:3-oxoacyl-[acyl-carrier protein] reductase
MILRLVARQYTKYISKNQGTTGQHMASCGRLNSIKSKMLSSKYLCFFGVGSQLQDCYEQIVGFAGREPDFFCDNDMQKWGASYKGITCVSPTQIGELRQDVAVVITVRNYSPIYSQLISMRIPSVFIACYGRGYNYLRTIKAHENICTDSIALEEVKDKWALITGATRGIGKQIAIEMAKLGCNIIVHGREQARAREIANICAVYHVKTLPVTAELGDTVALDGLLSRLNELSIAIDYVFNNAAISCTTKNAWHTSARDLMGTYAVNTIAPIRICQTLIPPMVRRGSGRVIMISSSIQRRPQDIAYACSKAALDKFVHDLSYNLKGTGVAMSLVDPGWVKTDMGGALAPNPVESVIPGVLLGAVLRGELNGRWFMAQDYKGMSLADAMSSAAFYYDDEDEDERSIIPGSNC